jgi:hypothetical protein
MSRDHPLASYGAFGFAVLAIFAGAVAAFALHEGSLAEAATIYTGLALVGASLLFAVYAGVRTWGDHAQPSVTLTPKAGDRIAVTVRGDGLRSSDHVVVEVEQLLKGETDGRLAWRPGQPLYGASLGPDGDGKIDETVEIPLPTGDYDDVGARAWIGAKPKDCYAHGNTTGCVRVHVPRPQERPQLAADWETFVRAPRLLIRVSAKNLPQKPLESMTLRVYGVTAAHDRRTLAEWSLAPDAGGKFDRRLNVVVGHAFSDVCIVASTSEQAPDCPPRDERGSVWSELAVPLTS